MTQISVLIKTENKMNPKSVNVELKYYILYFINEKIVLLAS